MRIRSVRIENFRSCEALDCDFGEVTTLIGPNGAGKSNVLRALDWFFNGEKDSLSEDDVFRGAGEEGRIRVRVDFEGLTDEDRAALGARYCPDPSVDAFTAWRSWQRGVDKITGKAFALPDFEQVRQQTTAVDKRSAYNAVRAAHPEYELPTATSAVAVEQAMEAWERAHPGSLSEAEVSDTHFFGFNGQGKLSDLFDFVFVSADLRASEETSGSSSSILGRILQRALHREELEVETAALVEKFSVDYEALSRKHLSGQLDELQHELSEEIGSYTQGRQVLLRNAPAVLKPVQHAVEIHVSDSVIETPVGLQGHGFQRTLILAALVVLSKRSRGETPGQMFLAIEEPELFQHPTQAKAFASVLRHLATDSTQKTQVAYATHSPHFVDPRYFDQVRRVSSQQTLGAACASSHLKVASLEAITSRLDGYVSARNIERRWDQVCLKYLPDALFAESVILVEGDEDAAILEGMGDRVNELAVSGICVAAVQGKNNMLIPYAILEALEVQALMVVDNDSGAGGRMRSNGKNEDDVRQAETKIRSDNRMFCRFVGGAESDYPVGAVTTRLAFVPDTMESLLESDLPGWNPTRQQIIQEGRGVEGKNAATYALAARECKDAPGAQLQDLLRNCTSKVA